MPTLITQSAVDTPIGYLLLQATNQALITARFADQLPADTSTGATGHAVLDKAKVQLGQYFSRERKHFELPIQPNGTDFQQKVWAALPQTAYGRTTTYQRIARGLGAVEAVRAVGRAIGRNPLALIIPCHRVLGRDGRLAGYAWGIKRKQWLLDFEQPYQQLTLF